MRSSKLITLSILGVALFNSFSRATRIGLRNLPEDRNQEASWNDGQVWGIGNYDDLCYVWHEDNHINYQYVDSMFGTQGCYQTNLAFFEHYLPTDRDWIDTNPWSSPIIPWIQGFEGRGQQVDQIFICREAELIGQGRWGPIPGDSRILFQKDVDDYRQLFRDAHAAGLIQRDNYKLIQLLRHESVYYDNEEARNIIMSMDGVAFEEHQFNVHWPFPGGKDIGRMVEAANWIMSMGKDYVLYIGPFQYRQCETYYDDLFKDWFQQYWNYGMPMRHPNMHYYLNAFPYDCGQMRRVGPETDPESIQGELKWLIEQTKL